MRGVRPARQGLVTGFVDRGPTGDPGVHPGDPGVGQARRDQGGKLIGDSLRERVLASVRNAATSVSGARFRRMGVPGPPVAGNLQHAGAGEAAVGEQKVLGRRSCSFAAGSSIFTGSDRPASAQTAPRPPRQTSVAPAPGAA